MRKIAIAATLAALLLMPSVAAHAAPPARDYETRLLHDHNDDSAVVLLGQHGFDSIALDAREGRLPNGEPALILRMLLNGGCSDTAQGDCGTLTHTAQFSADGTDHSIAFSTDDGGETWYGDASQYVGPMSINDGTRFAIEGWVPLSALGLATGSELTNWFVSSTDNMPQGAVAGAPDATGASYDIGTYMVAGDFDQFIALTAHEALIEGEGDVQVSFNVTNLITESQVFELEYFGGEGPATLDVAPNFTDTLTVNATEGSESVIVIARTALGGLAVAATAIQHVHDHIDESAFSSPDVPAGSTWSHTFRTPGIFAYHNHQAAHVSGAVHINPERGNESTHFVNWNGEAFEPAELHIKLGDTVTWTNNGTDIMSVMGGVTDDGSDPLAHDHDHDHGDEGEKGIPGPGMLVSMLVLLGAVLVARRR